MSAVIRFVVPIVGVKLSQMAVNGAWGKARAAIIRIAAEAMQYDANGIDIYFLNSLLLREGIVVCNNTRNCPKTLTIL